MNETGKVKSIRAKAVPLPLPRMDVSTTEAARRSLEDYLGWAFEVYAAGGSPAELIAQVTRTKLAIDNMQFPAAHESEAMKSMAREEIEKLRAMISRTDERSNEPQRE